jgi:transposase
VRRRRRSWSEDEKERIVAETLEPGASVSIVARRHDINSNLLFTWRRQSGARRVIAAGGGAAFVPAIIEAGRPASASPTCAQGEDGSPPAARPTLVAGRMEIVLASGDRVVVGNDVNEAALARVVAVLVRR